jgi:hypothetical protein
MTNRFAAGIGIVSLPATAAMLAITAGNYGLAVPFGILALLSGLLTAAPKLWVLHKLPVFGAVQLDARFRANGASGLRDGNKSEIQISIPAGCFPSTILVEIDVRNLTGRQAEHVLVGICSDANHGMRLCDGWGVPVGKGDALPPENGLDRASIAGMRLNGHERPLFHFRMRVRRAGAYRAAIDISSPSLYGQFESVCEIKVIEVESPCLRDRLGPVIDQMETIAKHGADAFMGDSGMRRALMNGTFEAHAMLLETGSQEVIDRFDHADSDYVGVNSGERYFRSEATAKARALYEIRDALGREDDCFGAIRLDLPSGKEMAAAEVA